MVECPHLSNAPIREAIIDIQVKFPNIIPASRIEEFGDIISEDYPDRRARRSATVKIRAGKEADVEKEEKLLGYLFRSKDNHQIIQARVDGFTFSRLKPYKTWEQLRGEAYRLWKKYVKHFKPKSIERVATRFINELVLEAPANLSDYLTAPLVKLESVPDILESFFTRVVIPNPKIPATVIITQALEKVNPDGSVPILLDIDVFHLESFSIESPKPWQIIDRFHDYKNSIFFESITKKTVEIYK